MKRLWIILLLFCSFDSHAFFLLEPGIGMTLGTVSVNELNGQTSYKHDGWTMGFNAFGRAGLRIWKLYGGVFGDISRHQVETSRETAGDSTLMRDGYDNSISQILTGYYGGFYLPLKSDVQVRLIGEYFDARAKIEYAEVDNVNLFTHDDRLRGRGFGAGVGVEAMFVAFNFIYRKVQYNKFIIDGETRLLPGERYFNRFTWHQFALQASIALDLF